jgi:hypothetical protein
MLAPVRQVCHEMRNRRRAELARSRCSTFRTKICRQPELNLTLLWGMAGNGGAHYG